MLMLFEPNKLNKVLCCIFFLNVLNAGVSVDGDIVEFIVL